MKIELPVGTGPEVLSLLDEYEVPYEMTWAFVARSVVTFNSEGMGWELFETLADITFVYVLLNGGHVGNLKVVDNILYGLRGEATSEVRARELINEYASQLFRKHELMLTISNPWKAEYTLEH